MHVGHKMFSNNYSKTNFSYQCLGLLLKGGLSIKTPLRLKKFIYFEPDRIRPNFYTNCKHIKSTFRCYINVAYFMNQLCGTEVGAKKKVTGNVSSPTIFFVQMEELNNVYRVRPRFFSLSSFQSYEI